MASVVTSKGREVQAGRMIGGTPTQAAPVWVAWGAPSAQFTAQASDVALFAEVEARVSGTASLVTTTTTNDTYQCLALLTATGNRAITEVGLMDATTQPAKGAVAAGGVVGSAVATTLNTAATFTPGSNFIQIRGEVMQVTAGSGSTSLTVTRGVNGSSAISTIAAADVVTPGNQPGVTATAGGTMMAHFDFAVINLVSGNTLTSTVQIQYT